MRALLCIPLLAFALSGSVLGQGVKFESGYLPQVMEAARATGKPVFVDVFATWCAPCHYMDDSVFTDAALGQFFGKHFLAVQLDAEAGEGVAFAREHGVRAFPTFLILSPDGKVLDRRSGAMSAQTLQIWMATATGSGGDTRKRAPKRPK